MKIVSKEEMNFIDANCGIPGLELMENAGSAVYAESIRLMSESSSKKALIIAGSGNNGGDGFAAARMLKLNNVDVSVCLLCDAVKLKGDAEINYHKALECGVQFISREKVFEIASEADLIIDAIFGTGFKSDNIKSDIEEIINFINSIAENQLINIRKIIPSHPVISAKTEMTFKNKKPKILSIDIPSGMSSDTGQISNTCIAADITVTFGRAKRGMYLYPGCSYCGKIKVDDIKIPEVAFDSVIGEIYSDAEIAAMFPIRTKQAHKGLSKVLIAGGSYGMQGAVQLAAYGALSANAGYVFISMPDTSNDNGFPIEAVRRYLSGRKSGGLALKAGNELLNFSADIHSVVIGGGLGRGEREKKIVEEWIINIDKPTVVDADAIANSAVEMYKSAKNVRILTPHVGEFSRLFGIEISKIEKDRVVAALSAAKKVNQIVLLKGAPTIIASPDGRYVINATGNEKLASCGSGDVLAGVIGALLAQGLEPMKAAAAGAYLHGKTAELWKYPVGLRAEKIAELIPKAWENILCST